MIDKRSEKKGGMAKKEVREVVLKKVNCRTRYRLLLEKERKKKKFRNDPSEIKEK